MKTKILLLVLSFGVFFFSFTSRKETTKISNSNSDSVNSLVQSTDYLKLQINSPMAFAEYTVGKNDKSLRINSANKDVVFIPNKGQIVDSDGKVRPDIFYYAFLNGASLYLTRKGMSFVFYEYERRKENLAASYRERKNTHDPFHKDEHLEKRTVKMYRMDLDIVGMNQDVIIMNEGQIKEYFNYYYGHCPEGITNVHGYRKVTFKNAYENIDIVFHSNAKGLKYDFIVRPGGNVSDIELKFKNDDTVYLTPEGKIRAVNPVGEIETDVLYTYQSDGKVIESDYLIQQDGSIKINTGSYDESKDLIIDPYIGATYYGGYSDDIGESITADCNNCILVTGTTQGLYFPLLDPGGGAYFQSSWGSGGDHEVFILKFNPNGSLFWATYYRGDADFYEYATSIAADGNNNILITGYTRSTDLPLQDPGGGAYFQSSWGGGMYDSFILKFNQYGVRLWATFYGGNYNDYGRCITSDDDNNILVTGYTRSYYFPLQDPGGGAYYQSANLGGHDAFILKFDSNGVRQWATFYGADYVDDAAYSIDSDNGIIAVTGFAGGSGFPLHDPGGGAYFRSHHSGGYDVFILKFGSNGVRQWATYYGGDTTDNGQSIAIDENNGILVTGFSESTNFSLFNPGGGAYSQGFNGYRDIFILKFDSNCIRKWATLYGGLDADAGNSVATDGNDNILVTGYTLSSNFPVYNPGGGAYYQGSTAGNWEAFILKFNTYGVRQWATFYGGSSYEEGNSIATDMNNNILVTGYTHSTNFPVHDPGGGAYFQGNFTHDKLEAFILGFRPSGSYGINILSTSVPGDNKLYQNYPNPFNPITHIRFDLRRTSQTKLIIYDILGKEVSTLVNEKLSAGSYEVDWDGSGFLSGVYFYTIKTTDFEQTKRMLMIK